MFSFEVLPHCPVSAVDYFAVFTTAVNHQMLSGRLPKSSGLEPPINAIKTAFIRVDLQPYFRLMFSRAIGQFICCFCCAESSPNAGLKPKHYAFRFWEFHMYVFNYKQVVIVYIVLN